MQGKDWKFMGHGMIAVTIASFLINLFSKGEISTALLLSIFTADILVYGVAIYKMKVHTQ